jgi:hypothetical protein
MDTDQTKDPKKVVKVVTTAPIVKDPNSTAQRLKKIFFGGSFKDVRDHVLLDVLIPGLRNTAVDFVSRSAEEVFFGRSNQRPRRMGQSEPMRYSYNQPPARPSYNSRPGMLPKQPPYDPRAPRIAPMSREPGEIIIPSRGEAETVIERMCDLVATYDNVSVADLYELLGLPCSPIDNKWGWTYIGNADVRQVRQGFLLVLPPVQEL